MELVMTWLSLISPTGALQGISCNTSTELKVWV